MISYRLPGLLGVKYLGGEPSRELVLDREDLKLDRLLATGKDDDDDFGVAAMGILSFFISSVGGGGGGYSLKISSLQKTSLLFIIGAR